MPPMGAPLYGGGGVNEPLMVASWLAHTLAGSSALLAAAPGGVFRGVADNSVSSDTIYVVYSVQASPDAAGVAGWRIKTTCVCEVAAVGRSAQALAVGTAAALIDQLLQRAPTQVYTTPLGDIRILESVRQSALALDEVTDGIQYVRSGGLYRIGARAA